MIPLPRWYLCYVLCFRFFNFWFLSLLSPVFVMLVLDTVLHGVSLVVYQLSGVSRNVVFEHVFALHILQFHPGKYERLRK